MRKRGYNRAAAALIAGAACSAASVALPPAEPMGACPATIAGSEMPRSRTMPQSVPAMDWDRKTDSYSVIRVDPLTFARGGPALGIGSQQQGWRQAASPDDRYLAVGGDRTGIDIIDVDRHRKLTTIDVGQSQIFLAWPHEDRIMAVTGSPGINKKKSLAIVDVEDGRVAARRTISGLFVSAAVSEDVLAVLTASSHEKHSRRSANLTVLRASGASMAVNLDGVESGYRFPGDTPEDRFGHYAAPGLAIDRNGENVYVFGIDGSIAEIDIDAASVTYSSLQGPAPTLVLEAAEAKLSNYEQLTAHALSNGLLAVTGHALRLERRDRDHLERRLEPSGLVLHDPEGGRSCMLDERADQVLAADDVLLAFRAATSGPDDGMGVTAYAADGRQLWHRWGDRAVDSVQVLNGHAYVTESWHGWRTSVVSLDTGRVIRAIRGRPPHLVGAASSLQI